MTVAVDGKEVRAFNIELADGAADFWVFLDVSAWKGKTALLRVREVPRDFQGLQRIEQADAIKNSDALYHERLRPQFHFTARRGWLNDPNGLVYYKGRWHMFFQHNPYGWDWGNMHWGHAVSSDLVHWKEQPIALYPNAGGDCYTGACFVDWKNQLGLKTGQEDVIVAFFLRTGIGLSYAFSNDRGMTWTDYPGNPLIKPHYGRIDSPKPFWHAPSRRWVAPCYDRDRFGAGQASDTVSIYSSADLKAWRLESNFGSVGLNAECPDLFELPVDGNEADRKWVLVFGDGRYIVGKFDGKTVTNLAGKPATTQDYVRSVFGQNSFHGRNYFGTPYYATQTFSDVPKADGRRIQIAWMRGSDFAGMPFNQQMTIPIELSLRTTEEGPRLFFNPVHEIACLHGKTSRWTDLALKPGANPLAGINGELFHIKAEIALGAATQVGFTLRGHRVVYDVVKQTLDGTPLKPINGRIKLEILLDRCTIETFANEGRLYMPNFRWDLPPNDRSLRLFASGGEAKVIALEVDELKSAWE